MAKKTILFISHTAARTGAPINLLRFLTWFKQHTKIPFRILFQSGGELFSAFESLAPVSVLYQETPAMFWHRASAKFGVQSLINRTRLKILKEQLRREQLGLIYSNTAMNGELLEWFAEIECPVISHIHELEYYISYHIGREHFERVTQYTDHYIAISDAVKGNLIERHHIEEKRIDTIYDFLPASLFQTSTSQAQQEYACVRQYLNLPDNAFLICASGTTDWRKSPDIFLQLAAFIRKHHPELPIYFAWIGGETDGARFGQIQHDLSKLHLQDVVHFLGSQADALSYFAACDLFVMVSREEPFGLVSIETAMFGKPTICFEGSGGPEEFVEHDGGYVVPYLDIEAMAEKCIELFMQPELRISLGQRARQKAIERHAIENNAPQILQVMQRFYRA